MKNLNGKELLRGDTVIAPIGGGAFAAGNIIQFYDRTNQFLIHGHALRINAKESVLAADAYAAIKGASESPKTS